VLVGLPQGVGGLAILFYFYLYKGYSNINKYILSNYVRSQVKKYKNSVRKSVEALKEWHLSPHAPTMAYDAALIDTESLLKGTMACPWLPQGAGAQGLNMANSSDVPRIMREAELKQQQARATEDSSSLELSCMI
jgi:hypothetical protein